MLRKSKPQYLAALNALATLWAGTLEHKPGNPADEGVADQQRGD